MWRKIVWLNERKSWKGERKKSGKPGKENSQLTAYAGNGLMRLSTRVALFQPPEIFHVIYLGAPLSLIVCKKVANIRRVCVCVSEVFGSATFRLGGSLVQLQSPFPNIPYPEPHATSPAALFPL